MFSHSLREFATNEMVDRTFGSIEIRIHPRIIDLTESQSSKPSVPAAGLTKDLSMNHVFLLARRALFIYVDHSL